MDQSDLILKSLETEPVKNLLNPLTKELGLVGDDIGSIIRFYVNQNLRKIFTKWADNRRDKPLPPDAIGKVMPLLQLASMQSNDELQERWAALLDNAVTAPEGVLPSFGQTLSQLTAQEARYIDRLYGKVTTQQSSKGRDLGGEIDLRSAYDERLRSLTYVQAQTLKKESEAVQLAIDDLLRLGIIAHRQETEQPKLRGNDPQSLATFVKKLQDVELKSIYSFTEYGLSFVRAVTPARDTNTEAE